MNELSPYFKTLAAQKRVCPKCHKAKLKIKPSAQNPNGAYEYCDQCTYIQTILAPEAAKVDKPKGKIIKFNNTK